MLGEGLHSARLKCRSGEGRRISRTRALELPGFFELRKEVTRLFQREGEMRLDPQEAEGRCPELIFLFGRRKVLSLEFFREQNLDSGAWRMDCLTGRIGAGRWGQSCREGEVWAANDAGNSLLVFLVSVFYPLRPPPANDFFVPNIRPLLSLCISQALSLSV